jgi:hypothetical protein
LYRPAPRLEQGARAGGAVTPPTARYDFNRDGVIDALDVAAVRGNLFRSLPDFSLSDRA